MANPTSYQRVTTATDYDASAGFLYLKFDGVDDALSTASIDFTATDKMTVVAGVRKLSDAAAGVLVELSVSAASNAGSFYIAAPESTGASGNYSFKSSGTTFPAIVTSGIKLAPISNVVACLSSISLPYETMRINQGQTDTSAASQGTGNYGNYPLFLGSRAGTSLPFNGHLYSLLIRGAQSTDAQIVAAEKFVATKTGVVL